MRFSDKMKACTLCPELVKNRTNVVIGDGPIPCNLVFLGEAPGETEDRTGTPFCGTSGTHLRTTARLEGLAPDTYNILNVLKCRPPDNRNPLAEEIANCRPFLLKQLKIINPKVILAVGRFAMSVTMDLPFSKIVVSKHMGVVHTFRGITCIGTYHPAFVLRNRYTDVEKKFRQHIRKARRLAYEV